mmetsp:Transcript_22248/g.71608  ORF Transcript_22248/g.71608 Transcript_22248/m.71608 type:complete len:371 (-) Transcript_22248:425-1537(-)
MPNFSNISGCSIGYCTISRSSRFTSSRPPMSSHVTLGTSTTVSRSEDGLDWPSASLKCSCVTASELSSPASMVSPSMSNMSILSRMQFMAASVHSAARSEPTKPCVSAAMRSRSTSSASFMLRVWMRSTSSRPFSSGTPMSISRSNRPNRRSAGSNVLGRLVAPMTTTLERFLRPSMRVSSWDTVRRSASPLPRPSRLGAIESISSMKMMAGAFFSASSNTLRRLLSLSPVILDMISGPFTTKKKAPVSLATARAISVLPDPGGPCSSTPRGGFTPSFLNSCGWRSGSSIISRIWPSSLRRPPMSSYPTSSIRSSSSRFTGSPSQWITVSGATMQYGRGSVSTTLNSTAAMPPRTMNVSPTVTGRYASEK